MFGRFTNETIQISGLRTFANNHWRNAITYYLNGVRRNEHAVMYRPKLSFDRFTLRLNTSTRRYWAHRNEPDDPTPMPFFSEVGALFVGDSQFELEVALEQFVHNDCYRMLVIELGDTGLIRLWKGKKRGELYCVSSCLPSMEDVLQETRDQQFA